MCPWVRVQLENSNRSLTLVWISKQTFYIYNKYWNYFSPTGTKFIFFFFFPDCTLRYLRRCRSHLNSLTKIFVKRKGGREASLIGSDRCCLFAPIKKIERDKGELLYKLLAMLFTLDPRWREWNILRLFSLFFPSHYVT